MKRYLCCVILTKAVFRMLLGKQCLTVICTCYTLIHPSHRHDLMPMVHTGSSRKLDSLRGDGERLDSLL